MIHRNRVLSGAGIVLCGYSFFAVSYVSLIRGSTAHAAVADDVVTCANEIDVTQNNVEGVIDNKTKQLQDGSIEISTPINDNIEASTDDIEQTKKIDKINVNGQSLSLIQGEIKSSFYVDAVASGMPHKVINSFIQILKRKISFNSGFRSGDKFSVAYNDKNEIYYLSIKTRKLDICAYRHPQNGTYHYYKNGAAMDHISTTIEKFAKPVDGARISSAYGPRVHPVLKTIKVHNGIDYAARRGTPVKAAFDGVVKKSSRDNLSGKYIVIQHKNGFETLYAHLDASNVKVGQRVLTGDRIGQVGATGRCTGAHLHFAMKKNGSYVNPTRNFTLVSNRPSKQENKAVAKLAKAIDQQIAGLNTNSI